MCHPNGIPIDILSCCSSAVQGGARKGSISPFSSGDSLARNFLAKEVSQVMADALVIAGPALRSIDGAAGKTSSRVVSSLIQ
jgi:hypothetical protein